MIVRDFNLERIVTAPHKTNSILVVDTNTVLPLPISAELLQAVGGRYPQVPDGGARIQQIEFVLYPAPELASNPTGAFGVVPAIDIRSRLIPETGDHGDSIPEYPLFMYKFEVEAFHV